VVRPREMKRIGEEKSRNYLAEKGGGGLRGREVGEKGGKGEFGRKNLGGTPLERKVHPRYQRKKETKGEKGKKKN